MRAVVLGRATLLTYIAGDGVYDTLFRLAVPHG